MAFGRSVGGRPRVQARSALPRAQHWWSQSRTSGQASFKTRQVSTGSPVEFLCLVGPPLASRRHTEDL